MSLSGLSQLNLEVNSTCDKTHLCHFCGHQNPALHVGWRPGEMDFSLLESIRRQVEPGITISWHRDGDPLAYSRLGEALRLFHGFTTSLVTHGLNLATRADELIDHCTTITVSIFRADPDRDAQFSSVREFVSRKGAHPPHVQVKIVGDLSDEEVRPYQELGVRIIRRLIHVPIGNSKYAHRSPTVPEVGVCLDALHRPTIDWRGDFFLCNRLDAKRDLLLGSVRTHALDALWNGTARQTMIEAHKQGRRELANPLCATCEFWGVGSA